MSRLVGELLKQSMRSERVAKELLSFSTSRSLWSLDQEDRTRDEERAFSFRPGDAPRPEAALPQERYG